MSNRTRAERRHERNRILAKRLRQIAKAGIGAINEVEWRFHEARRRIKTGTPCSCWMCGNPRRRYGNRERVLTRQEVIANLNAGDYS